MILFTWYPIERLPATVSLTESDTICDYNKWLYTLSIEIYTVAQI